ncbi:hypothetical protein E4U17_001772 [Claviceps sp. LM77 group G4]|nr:hypothetical protein E4U17_001772 [Claviceps sp. LM77 group G4]KAG6074345.1 hypothetical protein E4U33_002539 [Claviceps sp. LM78 group G4]KAG6076303.1 hypothetical protein E4U16_002872 [Claviceps sp. LM84 group G4]
MPFVPNTPESFVSRADSKNPSSTCRGITSSGRPCRRPISTSAQASLSPRGRNNEPKMDLSDETLYCWQHKEQASHSAQSSPGPRRHTKPILEERSSLDTLADRLGILDLQEKKPSKGGKGRPAKPASSPKAPKAKPRPQLTCCFCFSLPLDEVSEPARPKPRPQPVVLQKYETASVPSNFSKPSHDARPPSHPRISTPNAPPSKASYQSGKSTLSQTARFKHLLPDTLDVTTASALMAELAKPHTDSEEGGYIYMFWLTPETQKSKPPTEAARSLLAPPSVPSAGRSRRASDVVSSFAATDFHGRKTGQKTMLLKIGRAANVQRRMNQWQRQCGYDIEMLRYYPYVSGVENDEVGMGRTPRMTPHCRKVERLIHIELTGMGLRADMSTCEACGREHREWFEVQASRDGIRAVDEVIRRWVRWDEGIVD